MNDPDLAYAAKTWIARWPASRASILKGLASDPLRVRDEFVAQELNIIRKLHAANVPFLAGTDTPAGIDVIPGISLHLELERFVVAGFTPLEALQTATLNPAMFYEDGDYGSVQPGRVADLVLLDANPLSDIRNRGPSRAWSPTADICHRRISTACAPSSRRLRPSVRSDYFASAL